MNAEARTDITNTTCPMCLFPSSVGWWYVSLAGFPRVRDRADCPSGSDALYVRGWYGVPSGGPAFSHKPVKGAEFS